VKQFLALLLYSCSFLLIINSIQGQEIKDPLTINKDSIYLQNKIQATYQLLLKDKYYDGIDTLQNAIQQILPYKKDSIIALAYHVLGQAFYDVDQYAIAIEYWQQALSIRLELYNGKHYDVIKSHSNIGSVLLAQQKFEQAKDTLKLALPSAFICKRYY